MENNKRTQRTASEIIAETEARLERLRLREAKTQAQTDPAVAALLDQKESIKKDEREAKKILGSGPQSASARLMKHEIWISKIKDEATLAELSLDTFTAQLADVDAQIQAALTAILSQNSETN